MRIASLISEFAKGEGEEFTADVKKVYDLVYKLGSSASTNAEEWAQLSEAKELKDMPNLDLTDKGVNYVRTNFK